MLLPNCRDVRVWRCHKHCSCVVMMKLRWLHNCWSSRRRRVHRLCSNSLRYRNLMITCWLMVRSWWNHLWRSHSMRRITTFISTTTRLMVVDARNYSARWVIRVVHLIPHAIKSGVRRMKTTFMRSSCRPMDLILRCILWVNSLLMLRHVRVQCWMVECYVHRMVRKWGTQCVWHLRRSWWLLR